MSYISVPVSFPPPIHIFWKCNGYVFASNNSDDYLTENLDANNYAMWYGGHRYMNKTSYSLFLVRMRSIFFQLKFKWCWFLQLLLFEKQDGEYGS